MKRAGEVWLLDANLLIALVHSSHIHHALAHRWFDAVPRRSWATCALTQLAFLRLTMNPRVVGAEFTASAASEALVTMTAHPAHVYWEDSPAPAGQRTLASAALGGHRQVTDAYLLTLTVERKQRLATLDRGLQGFSRALGVDKYVEWISDPAVHEPAPGRRP